MKPSLSSPLLVGLFALGALMHAAETKPAATDERYELPKMEVKSRAICSFGIGVIATWDQASETVTHLYVDTVAPGSAAETFGLVHGDEILTLNGRKVTTLKGGLKRGSDLFNLLVDQPPGREIKLEVAVRLVKHVSLNAVQ
jgi:S1-C subfamily serine protease